MIFPENIEVKLGFDKIRSLVMGNCLSTLGKGLVADMQFTTDAAVVATLVNQTNEFVRILQDEDDFPVSYYFDLRQPLHRIGVVGTFLEEKELWDLRRTMDTIGQVVSFFKQKEGKDYPYLKELATDVFTFPDLIRLVDRVVDPLGQVKDNASPALAEIRASIASTSASISRSLSAILRQAKADGIIDTDVSPSIRDGRLVIPVAPMHKRRIRGIVHDESATGKTVFIEPEVVVEANNRIRELQADEKREIIRILTDLTNQIRPRVPELEFSLSFLAEIDFIRAKARFATETNSLLPQMTDTAEIEWYNAVHPLLFLSHQRQGKQVVPLTIHLDSEDRILLISGPNAGGKSVCLKTVGLLTYMFQCGMLVPMNDNSRIGIFSDLFIDIGDEQSIENDLSTYSSHMSNMKTFVRNCNSRSLILIDEFGSGTEPQIGGALAVALLHNFNNQHSFGVITTHYNSLKNFATDTDGIVNGAMLYERHLMQPLFKLEMGNPGSSFAVDIARKMGLPESIIKEAEEIVGSDYVNMDKYLQDIVRDKRYWENKRQNIRMKSKQIEEVEARYAAELQDLADQRKQLIKQSKEEAKLIIAQANAMIENTVRQIKEAQAEKEKTREVRKAVEDFKEKLNDEESAAIDRKIAKLREKEERKKQKKNQPGAATAEAAKPAVRPLEVGDTVRVKGQQNAGQLLSISGSSAMVQLGPMKMNVKLEQLERVSNSQMKKESRQMQQSQRSNVMDQMRKRSLKIGRAHV